MAWGRMELDEMQWDGMGSDGMGWDGTGWAAKSLFIFWFKPFLFLTTCIFWFRVEALVRECRKLGGESLVLRDRRESVRMGA